MNQQALPLPSVRPTQKQDLKNWLDEKGKITRAEAFYDLGIAELSARIIDIESEGFIVPREMIEVKARNGRKCRVMQYGRPYQVRGDG